MNKSISPKCRFCEFFEGAQSNAIDTPWLVDTGYRAIVSKGAMVPGWSLVCPVEHAYSLAKDYSRPAFWDFANRAAKLVAQRFGAVRVFEHGAAHAGSLTGCGTDHAHLHLVPLDFSLATEAMRYDASVKWERCRASEIVNRCQGREYLFVSDEMNGVETEGLLCMLDRPISQYFRRVIATRIGLREFYDYKTHPMLEIARVSAEQLSADAAVEASVGSR